MANPFRANALTLDASADGHRLAMRILVWHAVTLLLIWGALGDATSWAQDQTQTPAGDSATQEEPVTPGRDAAFPKPTSPDDWITVTVEETDITLMMPAEPKKIRRTLTPVPGESMVVHLNICSLSQSNSFVFAYNKLTERAETPKQVKDVLDGAVKGALARTLGELKGMKAVRANGHQGREFEFTCVQGQDKVEFNLHVLAKVILIDDTLYQLTYVASEEEYSEADARKFLNSFTCPKAVTTQPGPSTGGGR